MTVSGTIQSLIAEGKATNSAQQIQATMRIVVKIGTSLIAPGGRMDTKRMRSLVDQLDLIHHEYILVSSGAIASGMSSLGIRKRPRQLALMQASAAVGQSRLMHTYERLFFGKKLVAQLLLSSDDFSSPVRYHNLCNTLSKLLRLKVLPIVNENDSVSVRELEGAFGDNDELSALVASAVRADWLILLTDVDGFYRERGRNSKPQVARMVRRITPAMEAFCNGRGQSGRGGMRSKLRAALRATASGIHVVIANGKHPRAISLALHQRLGTYFPPLKAKL
jgi:glutamate 5-kinase